MVIIQVTKTEAAFHLVSYYHEGDDKATEVLLKSKSNCFSSQWVVAEGKRAYIGNNLHFIKNNGKSLQTFLANMQLSGMDGKETFSPNCGKF